MVAVSLKKDFFQAEDGIRDQPRSRGLGDVYKRQGLVSTGIAWLLRFRILVNNGLIFQSQVSYLIPIFGTILSYIFLKELITFKVLISLIAVSVGIYFVRKADNKISNIRLD